MHHKGEPSEQWPDPLTVGISKANREKLERSYQKASGKVPLDANGPNLSNTRKSLHSVEPEETIQVIKAANHFYRHGSQHSSLVLSQMLPLPI